MLVSLQVYESRQGFWGEGTFTGQSVFRSMSPGKGSGMREHLQVSQSTGKRSGVREHLQVSQSTGLSAQARVLG